MADDSPEMLPFTVTHLDFEVGIRRYDPDLAAAMQVTPDWVCPLILPTPMHTWVVPGLEREPESFVQLEELAQVDPDWIGASIQLTRGTTRVAGARRVRLYLGEDPWGVDTYFRDYDGKTVWAVNIRRVPSPRDTDKPALLDHLPNQIEAPAS